MHLNSKLLIRSYISNSKYVKSIRNYVKHAASEISSQLDDLNLTKRKIKKVLNVNTMNERIVEMEYAVRGRVPTAAKKIKLELQQGIKKPFKEVISTNLGDPHAMGQIPITFTRQVAMLTLYPTLLQDYRYPSDVKKRANMILSGCPGHSVGSFTNPQGMESVRKHIAEFIMARDGGEKEVDPSDIFIAEGASSIIKTILSLFNKEIGIKPTGCMVSVPQYPLFSASVGMQGLYKIDYYLEEDKQWRINVKELKRALEAAKPFCVPRVLILINPGNPTGCVLSRKTIEDVIKFAFNEDLLILADEVYQVNIFGDNSEFVSVRKAMLDLGMPYSKMELISFNSSSKGFTGECGFRSGYAELFNIDKEVKAQLLKTMSVMLCPNAIGQVILDTVICPPKDGDPSCELYKSEKCCILNSLRKKAKKVHRLLNNIDGIQCNPIDGALYAFPKIEFPEKFLEMAKNIKREPDELFCLGFLKEKGICVVPGSGFGQLPGTYHIRTTILPPEDKLEFVVKQLSKYLRKIYKEYGH